MDRKKINLGEVSLRLFSMDDYDALISLWQRAELGHRPRGRDSREKVEAELERGIARIILAEYRGEVIGSVIVTHDGRKGWINRVAVDPLYRGNGLAQRLVEEAENILYDLGLEILTCLVEEGNIASQSLFEKMGYVRWDGLVYYSKRKYDDV